MPKYTGDAMTLEKYFIWFIFYSFLGWVYETIYCSIADRKLVNRGFLNGPYCPIYGFGAIINIVILGGLTNKFLIFLCGVILTGILEYATSYGMEKIFHAKWWDYSTRKFNINGRVCLLGMVVFGIMSVLVVAYLHPFVKEVTQKIPLFTLHTIGIVSFLIFAFDTVYTNVKIHGFNKRIAQLSAKIRENVDLGIENAAAHIDAAKTTIDAAKATLEDTIAAFKKKMNFQERRIMRAFPKLKFIRYDDIMSKIRKNKEK